MIHSMWRRCLLFLATVVGMWAFGPGACVARAAAVEKPNVLLICIDDLNDWVGCLGGHPQVKTPHIDRLAEQGVVFANAHCQAPICNPSRVSFMTGMLPSTSGVYLLSPSKFRVSPALRDCVTLPEYLGNHGYATVGCGKVYHNSSATETFQKYGPRGGFGPRPKRKINHPVGHPLWDWGVYPERDEQMPDHQVASWAIEQIEGGFNRPFFLAVGFCRPHVPMYAPQRWWDLYPEEDAIELPKVLAGDRDDLSAYARGLTYGGAAPRHEWMVENNQWRRAVRAYLACTSFVDHQVGRVLAALEASTYAKNTIVVLLGDHGWALGEKQRWAKRALWQRETGVPLVIAAPGMAAGAKTTKPVGLIDIYPTLVELCGLAPNKRLEGTSLVPLLADPQAAWDRPTLCTFWKDNHAVIAEQWRLICYADGSQELYDTRRDHWEWHNLAGDPKYREVIDELARYLPKNNAPAVPGSRGLDGRLPDGRP